MKKLVFILSVSFLILFSCSSDSDERADVQENYLIGKWEPTMINAFPEGTKIDNNVQLFPYNQQCTSSRYYLEFDDNDTGVSVSFDNNCVQENSFFVWSLTGNFLIITDDSREDIEEYELIFQSSKTIILKSPLEEIDDNIFGNYVISFVKI